MKFIPQRDYILASPKSANITKSGLHLVKGQIQGGQEVATMVFAEVVAASAGFRNENGVDIWMPFATGDHIAYHPSAAQEIHDGKERFHLVKLNAVLCRVENFSEVIDVLGEDSNND